MNITGTGFTPNSTVLVNGNARATTFESPTLLQATLLPSDLAHGGTLIITVTNPPPGGGTTAAINFVVADYAVSAASLAPPVVAGQTADFTLTVSPSNGAFSDPVMFSVLQLPAGASAAFAPSATVTPGASALTVTLLIATMPHTVMSHLRLPLLSRPIAPLILAVLGCALATFCLGFRGNPRHGMVGRLCAVLLLLALAGFAGCGAVTGTPSAPQVNPSTGTPAGTYPLIVTAASGGISHQTTVTLTVQ